MPRPVRTALAAVALSLAVAPPAQADLSPAQPLPFAQDWSNAGLITANDDWSGVPGVRGYLGDSDAGSPTGVDPRTLTADARATVDVNANEADPNTSTAGGVTEFDLADDVVALQGSGTADAPYLVFAVATTGSQDVAFSARLRDLDGSADNAVQQVALQYRVGTSGAWTKAPGSAAYVADATSGPSLATRETTLASTLPAVASNQPVVQFRVLTTNAGGSDEWVGVDDVAITPNGAPPVERPELSCPDSLSVAVGSSGTAPISAADADGTVTAIELDGAPAGASFSKIC